MLIDIKELAKKYNIKSKGVLHIGAHEGQEAEVYAALGMDKMFFIEADPNTFAKLENIIKIYPKAKAINACISDEVVDVNFNISSNEGQSSSILQLGTHKVLHPEVTYIGAIPLRTQRIDKLLTKKDLYDVDFLNIDIQGMELPALKSMGKHLKKFNYVYLEVNRGQVYEGCAEIEEVDAFLLTLGFERRETQWVNEWGDAFYTKANIMATPQEGAATTNNIPVSEEVLPGTISDPLIFEEMSGEAFNKLYTKPAPINNVKEEGMILQVENSFLPIKDNFERWFAENVSSKELSNRIYIPIQWDAYYSVNEWGRNMDSHSHIQHVLDKLDPKEKYFTICEWPEGVLSYFKGKDIKVFGPGDVNIDYRLDLSKSKEDTKAFILDKIKS